jgi:hypothetical protein
MLSEEVDAAGAFAENDEDESWSKDCFRILMTSPWAVD